MQVSAKLVLKIVLNAQTKQDFAPLVHLDSLSTPQQQDNALAIQTVKHSSTDSVLGLLPVQLVSTPATSMCARLALRIARHARTFMDNA